MRKIFQLLVAAALTGCYSFHVSGAAQPQGILSSRTGATFVFGLIGTDAVASECQHGLAFVETSEPWWGFVVTGITFGLITPWHAEWACAASCR